MLLSSFRIGKGRSVRLTSDEIKNLCQNSLCCGAGGIIDRGCDIAVCNRTTEATTLRKHRGVSVRLWCLMNHTVLTNVEH